MTSASCLRLNGVRVIESLYLTEATEVPRTRRERWLTWPWRPWQRTKIVRVPAQHGYRLADGSIMVHPAHARALRGILG